MPVSAWPGGGCSEQGFLLRTGRELFHWMPPSPLLFPVPVGFPFTQFICGLVLLKLKSVDATPQELVSMPGNLPGSADLRVLEDLRISQARGAPGYGPGPHFP